MGARPAVVPRYNLVHQADPQYVLGADLLVVVHEYDRMTSPTRSTSRVGAREARRTQLRCATWLQSRRAQRDSVLAAFFDRVNRKDF